MPWRWGLLRLEDHPDLIARQAPGTPSRFWEVAKDPLVAGMLRRLMSILGGADYHLERPELPAWLEGNPLAEFARDLQFAYLERVFYGWLQSGRRGFKRFVRDSVLTTPIEGFSWYEIVAEQRTVDLGPELGTHEVWWPEVPEWRAPWSIWWWLTSDEQLVGVVAGFSYSTDYGQSNSGTQWQTVIPADKMLLVTTGQVGSNFLGRSWLRDIYNYLLAKRDAFALEQLSYEVNGVGELFFKLPERGVASGDQISLENYVDHRKGDHAPGGVLPYGVEPMRLKGEVLDFSPLLKRLDIQISQAWNQDDRLIALGDHGARAARETASEDARDGLDDVAQELIAEPIEELFERMIRASFPELAEVGHVYVPRLSHTQVEETDNAAYIAMLAQAVGAGLIKWQPEHERALLKLTDLDVVSADEGAPGEKEEPADDDPVDAVPAGADLDLEVEVA